MAETSKPIVVSRESLYREVWKEPLTKLAPKYGLSDVGLAKVCRKHDIPRPPVGYWAKQAFGHVVDMTPLPELDDESLAEITFFRQQFFGDSNAAEQPLRQETVIEVPERLHTPHQLILKVKNAFANERAGEDGLLHAGKAAMGIRVSRKHLGRALRILDALLKNWEESGGSILAAESQDEPKIAFCRGIDAIKVDFFEDVERSEKKSKTQNYWREWQYKPTGNLVLTIDGYACGLRKRWADGKRQRLEKLLGKFVESLDAWVEDAKVCRLDCECKERQRAQAREVRQERKDRRAAQEAMATDLEQSAEQWERSNQIRRYLNAFKQAKEKGAFIPKNPNAFEEWFSWAEWYADHLDPTITTPHRADCVDKPINKVIADLDLTRNATDVVAALGVSDTDQLYAVDRESLAQFETSWSAWSEICRVLEGLRYEVSGRECYYDYG